MSTATSDDFLSGQGVSVEPSEIEMELMRLWGPAAEQVGGPDLENPHVTRISLSNLVVLGYQHEAARLLPAIETVAAQHPSRTIVMRRTDDPARAIRAEISALCHLPAPGMPQVCSERIVFHAGPNAVDLLPGAVRPVLEAELPFVLWWTHDPREDEALFRDLADECSRLILDLPDPAADIEAIRLGLDTTICAHARDAAWFGLTRWRELVAQLFDPPGHQETLTRIDALKIEASAPTNESTPRMAVWLAAWLAGQLGWTPVGRPERSHGRLAASFRSGSGDIAEEILTQAVPDTDAVRLQSTILTTRPGGPRGAEYFRLLRVVNQYPEVRVEIDSSAYCTLPRTVLAPELDPAHRVSAALESSRDDPPFQKALPHALWLMGG